MPGNTIELIILTGFLGSGKTSLLVDFLMSKNAANTGVIVNEVGEIGIDGGLVYEDSGTMPYALLDNGCVCCSIRGSLVNTVERLLLASPRSGPLDRIIIETSGVSRPGPIANSLSGLPLSTAVRIITTIDATRAVLATNEFDEAVAQLTGAQQVVITKLDLVSEGQIAATSAAARASNPFAEIILEPDRARRAMRAFLSSNAPAGIPLESISAGAHPRLHIFCGRTEGSLEWGEFARWTDNLTALCGDALLRFKALVVVADCAEPVLVQSVGTTFSSPRRMSRYRPTDTGIVVITRDVDLDAISRVKPALPWARPLRNAASAIISRRTKHATDR
jgi:G3E family GTPase